MSLTFSCMQRSQFKGEKDTLALFDWEDDKINAIGWLDSKKEALMKNMAQKEGFKGKPGADSTNHDTRSRNVERYLYFVNGPFDLHRLDACAFQFTHEHVPQFYVFQK